MLPGPGRSCRTGAAGAGVLVFFALNINRSAHRGRGEREFEVPVVFVAMKVHVPLLDLRVTRGCCVDVVRRCSTHFKSAKQKKKDRLTE